VSFVYVHHVRAARQTALDQATAASLQAPTEVDVAPVSFAPKTQPLTLPGQTSAWYYSTVYARVNGYVENWTSDIGDRVKKGQVMATIETPDLDDQLNAAVAQVKASEAEVTVAQADADFAKQASNMYNAPKGVVSELERAEKRAEYDSSIAKLNAAKAQVNLDQADVGRLTALTEFKQVVAPFDGVVTARHIDIGDLVTAGSTANTTSLYSVAEINKIRVFVDVPEQATGGLAVGTPAVVSAPEFQGRTYEGVVARTANAIDPVSKTLRVEVDLPNKDLSLLPGLYVQVTFNIKQAPAVQVPASALLYRSTGPQVAVVGQDGKVEFHSVNIASDLGNVVVLSSGVTANENVALNLSDQVSDGDLVKPNYVTAEEVAGITSPAPATPAVSKPSPSPASPPQALAAATAHHF